jgi:hypothetical protein
VSDEVSGTGVSTGAGVTHRRHDGDRRRARGLGSPPPRNVMTSVLSGRRLNGFPGRAGMPARVLEGRGRGPHDRAGAIPQSLISLLPVPSWRSRSPLSDDPVNGSLVNPSLAPGLSLRARACPAGTGAASTGGATAGAGAASTGGTTIAGARGTAGRAGARAARAARTRPCGALLTGSRAGSRADAGITGSRGTPAGGTRPRSAGARGARTTVLISGATGDRGEPEAREYECGTRP